MNDHPDSPQNPAAAAGHVQGKSGIRARSGEFADAAIYLAIVSAFLYLLAWGYLYAYLSHFNIRLFEMDLSKEYLLVFGAMILRTVRWYWYLSLYLGVAVLFYLCRYTPFVATLVRRHPRLRHWRWLVLLIDGINWIRHASVSRYRRLLVLLFPLIVVFSVAVVCGMAFDQGDDDYYQRASRHFCDYPAVRIWLKSDAAAGANGLGLTHDVVESLASGAYRIAYQDAHAIMLFAPDETGGLSRLVTYQLSWDSIAAMRSQPVGCD